MTAQLGMPAAADVTAPGRRSRRGFRKFLPQYLAISPFYLLFAVFGLFPVLFTLYLAFHRWDGIGAMDFVGLRQFGYLLGDRTFWLSVLNTVEIWVLSTVPMLSIALVLAVALNSSIRFGGFYRIAYFVPNVTSIVAIAIIFGSVFGSNFGLVNAVLRGLGLSTVEWLTTGWGIKVAIAAMIAWQWTGYNAIIFLAGLQRIPADVYEAAKVDGAGSVSTFFRITLPLLRPIILFSLIMTTVGGLQTFTEPQVLLASTGNLDSGGPGQAGLTIVLYFYQQAFDNNDYGYGAAIAWGLFVLVVLFSIINWRLVRRREH
ncbi:carbohydrate ABC transporter permease [Amycolatopsis sp. NPDC058986]|uniref:carbohydrate ABC transporter permease n=1 Tax=unclassified Amycolatopsis TaxID=2618356 RepID=UPI00366B4C86